MRDFSRRHLLVAAAVSAAVPAFAQTRFVTPRPHGVHVGRVERAISGVTAPALIHYPALGAPAVARAAEMPARHHENLTRRFGDAVADALFDGRGYAAAGAAADGVRHPVLAFAPGARLAAYDYRAVLEDVASRGFVVIAVTPDDSADYAGASSALRTAVSAAMAWADNADDRLGAVIDKSRAGAFGHSVGGAAAVLAASEMSGIHCAANLDGDYIGEAAHARPQQPLFYLATSDAHENRSTRERRARTWAQVSASSASASATRVASMEHLSFLDAALLKADMPSNRRTGRFGEIAPVRAVELTATLLAAFFDEWLNNQSGALAGALRAAPEVG